MKLVVKANHSESSKFVSDMLIALIKAKPDAMLGLATGGTVTDVYANLVEANKAGKVDFSNVRTANLDEYIGLPLTHEQSFADFMNRNLFNHLNIKRDNVQLMDGMKKPEDEIDKLKAVLADRPIDLQLLGVGNNGHIGFNEPGDTLVDCPHIVELTESTIEANARFFDKPADVPRRAITMGVGDILRAKSIVLLATGAPKADAIRALLKGDIIDPRIPCTILKAHRDVTVVIDEALAKMVD